MVTLHAKHCFTLNVEMPCPISRELRRPCDATVKKRDRKSKEERRERGLREACGKFATYTGFGKRKENNKI